VRRTPLRPAPQPDRVSYSLRQEILRRDGACLYSIWDPAHVCRDAWGAIHAPTALDRLSLEHVKDELRMGKRATSDAAHLIALCAAANIGVPSKEFRAFAREYLADVAG
jgi:hypothetical protein